MSGLDEAQRSGALRAPEIVLAPIPDELSDGLAHDATVRSCRDVDDRVTDIVERYASESGGLLGDLHQLVVVICAMN